MILDHVRVFAEDKKFTDGGIVIKDGRIAEGLYRGELSGSRWRKFWMDRECMRYRGLLICIFMAVWGMISATVTGKLLKELRSMRASCGGDCDCTGNDDTSGGGAGAYPLCGSSYKKTECTARRRQILSVLTWNSPFISRVKKGAQDERNIIPCDTEVCDRFLRASEGLVKFIGSLRRRARILFLLSGQSKIA